MQTFICGFCFELVKLQDNHFDHACELCEKAFRCHALLQRHMSHQETTTCCNNCGDELRGCAAVRSAHGKSKQPCSFCRKSFGCETHLKNHWRDSTACKQFLQSIIANDARSSSAINKKCNSCGQQLNTFEERFEHLRERMTPCGMHFACSTHFTRHVRMFGCQQLRGNSSPSLIPDDSCIRCELCRVECATQAELQKHVEMSFCPRCGYMKRCRTLIKAHLTNCRIKPRKGQPRCRGLAASSSNQPRDFLLYEQNSSVSTQTYEYM